MQKPVSRTFVVRGIVGEGRSRRGDPFIECDADGTVVAFWALSEYRQYPKDSLSERTIHNQLRLR
jgi:hypothetical protein